MDHLEFYDIGILVFLFWLWHNIISAQAALGLVGIYAPCGLSPQTDYMHTKFQKSPMVSHGGLLLFYPI